MKKILYVFLALTIVLLFLVVLAIYPHRCQGSVSNVYKAYGDVEVMTRLIQEFREENDRYPNAIDDLIPKYIARIPHDPWRRQYIYKVNSDNTFQVYSLGSDLKSGGRGAANDIFYKTNWQKVIESIYKPVWGCNA